MEDDVQYYKLKNIKLTDEHKRKISAYSAQRVPGVAEYTVPG